MEEAKEKLCGQILAFAQWLKIPVQVPQIGSMFTVFFSDAAVYARFFHALLEHGVYFPPSQFEVCFVSAAHNPIILKKALKAITQSLERTSHA